MSTAFWSLADWRLAYADGAEPLALLGPLRAGLVDADPAWISRIDPGELERRCRALAASRGDAAATLWGIPFAVKDNIDAAGFATTCACPAFAYRPSASASAVARLEAAGAIVFGKTNLDQFATGLVGTRSPYGAVPNSFDARHVSGGSSSGSASLVARGIVPFALGTDTAGSGRVPAGHNNLVGLKPTRGLVSTRGVVPACRTLDCVSAFALSVGDVAEVVAAMSGYDAADAYSRRQLAAPSAAWPEQPRLGIPRQLEWFGDAQAAAAHGEALRALAASGATLVPIDTAVLDQVAALLYDGPWVAERAAAVGRFLSERPDAFDPAVLSVIGAAAEFNAVDAFRGHYRLAELKRAADALLAPLDGLVVPTAPTLPTIEAVRAEPIVRNSEQGRYTNFVNLLDWCAIAVPAGLRGDGLPAGLTLIAPAWQEARLVAFGRHWQAVRPWRRGTSQRALAEESAATGATGGRSASSASSASGATSARATSVNGIATADDDGAAILVAVVGAHLRGLPLNGQLTSRGGRFVEATTTSAEYRLYALPNTTPAKPGLVRTDAGAPIAVELWSLPLAHYGSFVAGVPSPLAIGTLTLADGRQVQGFVCEAWACAGAADITAFGGWRAYLAHGAALPAA